QLQQSVTKQSSQFINSLFRCAINRSIITQASPYNFHSFCVVVNLSNLDAARRFVRQLFVAEEVVFKSIYQSLRAIMYVFEMAIGDIGFKDGDNLVIRLRAVNHAQAADGTRADEEITMRECLFCQHADI